MCSAVLPAVELPLQRVRRAIDHWTTAAIAPSSMGAAGSHPEDERKIENIVVFPSKSDVFWADRFQF